MKKCLVSLCVLLGSTAANAAADDLDTVMHALAQREQGTASFVEQHFIALLKRPVESSGTLFYQAPDTLEKRTLKPHPESLLLRGDVLTVQRGRRTRVLDLKAYPGIAPFVLGLRATLAGDRSSLERVFQVKFAGTAASWSLDLVPADPAMMKTVAEVRIDGVRDVLTQVEIRTADGDRSVMTLTADSKAP
jgi:hypothetical protein